MESALGILAFWIFLIKFDPREKECPLIILVLSEGDSKKVLVAFRFFSYKQIREELGKFENLSSNIKDGIINDVHEYFPGFPEESEHQCEIFRNEAAEEVRLSTQGIIALHTSLRFERIEVVDATGKTTLTPKDRCFEY